jgi:hypothetical protein
VRIEHRDRLKIHEIVPLLDLPNVNVPLRRRKELAPNSLDYGMWMTKYLVVTGHQCAPV